MISSVIPKLPFIDRQLTIQFYERLGFQVRSDYVDYFIMEQPPVELQFFSYPALQPGQSDFMIYCRVNSEIENLYSHLQEKGIDIHPNGKLNDKPWRQKEFSIIDPNGTLLTFGQAIDQ